MTRAAPTHWLTALLIALAAGVFAYGVLFVEPLATLAAGLMGVAVIIAMRKGWLATRGGRKRR